VNFLEYDDPSLIRPIGIKLTGSSMSGL